MIFDIDDKFSAKCSKLGGKYCKYDFNEPSNIPEEYHHAFEFILIDPPFIT